MSDKKCNIQKDVNLLFSFLASFLKDELIFSNLHPSGQRQNKLIKTNLAILEKPSSCFYKTRKHFI